MYQGNVCRLCVEICEDYKSLYDESDDAKEVHQLMIQYFDQELFTGNKFNVMCMKCWQQISDFNTFQQSICRAQTILHIKEEEIDIKLEEEFLPEQDIAGSNSKHNNASNIFAAEIFRSSSRDSFKTDGNMNERTGGELENEDNSTELPNSAALNVGRYEALKTKEICRGVSAQNWRRRTKYKLAAKASDDLIARWTTVLKCIFCTETCSTYSMLQCHFQDKHPLKKCQVRCCGKNYNQRDRYEDHVRLHMDPNAFACKFCGTQQECRRTLAFHIREQHPDSNYATVNPRDDCNTVSQSSEISTGSIPKNVDEWKLCTINNSAELPESTELNAEFNETLKIKTAKRTKGSISEKQRGKSKFKLALKASDDLIAQWMPVLKCLYCKDTCSSYSLLQSHFQNEHPLLKSQVKCCGKYYSRRERFVDHIRLHFDSNAFACKYCFTQQECRKTLALHIREHHSALINATVNSRDDTKTVSLSSGKVRENSTESIPKNVDDWKMCTTNYIKESDDFIAKMRPTLKCDLCPEECSTYSLLQQHFSDRHPENKCYITCCQNKLTARYRVFEHLQLHSNPDAFKCELCEVRYSNRDELQSHLHKRHTTFIKENAKPRNNKNMSDRRYQKSDELWAKWLPSTECAICKKAFTTLTLLKCHFLGCHPNEKFHVECCQRKLQVQHEIDAHARYHVEPAGYKCELCCFQYSQEKSLRVHMRIVH